MNSTRLKEALQSAELLSETIRKRRTLVALNEFIDERINGTAQAIQPLTEDIRLNSVVQLHKKEVEKEELKTQSDDLGVIKTEEMCYTPFPFVQSETLSYPDGKRVVTTFYPDSRKIPSRRVEYSANKLSVSTTTYDRNGNEKQTVIKTQNCDGTSVEEKIDYKYKTKEIRKFNSQMVNIILEGYLENKITFRMDCDNNGNIVKEATFFAYTDTPVLKKETIYNSNKSYTVKEYSFDGRVLSSVTSFVKK